MRDSSLLSTYKLQTHVPLQPVGNGSINRFKMSWKKNCARLTELSKKFLLEGQKQYQAGKEW